MAKNVFKSLIYVGVWSITYIYTHIKYKRQSNATFNNLTIEKKTTITMKTAEEKLF